MYLVHRSTITAHSRHVRPVVIHTNCLSPSRGNELLAAFLLSRQPQYAQSSVPAAVTDVLMVMDGLGGHDNPVTVVKETREPIGAP